MKTVLCIVPVLSLLLFAHDVRALEPASNFSLKDPMGQTHQLSDFRGKHVVLEWFNPDCPFVKKHYNSGNMQLLQKDFTQQGVVWLSINSSAQGKQGHYSGAEHDRLMAEKGGSPTTILLDPMGHVGHLYQAKTTPHMFVINPDGDLVYDGAIDDYPSTDPADVEISHNYVRAALSESMNGQAVSEPQTTPYGCSVKY